MMAVGHALTGALGGLYGTALLQQDAPGTLLAGALVCAGAALLPDIDHPSATAAQTFGGPSRALARAVAAVSRSVHATTRSRWDRPDGDGHRAVTHTLVFAVATGLLCWAAARVSPALVVFPLACMVAHVATPNLHLQLSRRRAVALPTRSVPLTVVLGVVATWTATDHLVGPRPALWLGGMVALGCLVHCLGDAVTEQGCPILWPMPILGRRWYPLGSPRFLRFTAGGKVERLVVVPLVALLTILFGGVIVVPRVVLDLLFP